ncbi:50S ribosomal protein L24 [Candidatus Saccharibacteria bacterium]|nr:50S ribosomal protein L24 [Candidatus Saccharibacteria bacterium]NCU40966.1 50S ribosomal protein L24 [Candidatus Saccharibacteria bacterium]
MTMRIKKGDLVKVIAGSYKGKTTKVERIDPVNSKVFLEGIGTVKRHIKPSQANPRGGSKDVQKSLPVSNVALVVDETKSKTAKIGYKKSKDSKKVRINRSNGKEI